MRKRQGSASSYDTLPEPRAVGTYRSTTPDGSGPRRQRRWRPLLVRLGALGLSALLALLLCEVAVRVLKPQVLFPRYVTDSGFGIRVNVHNARYWHTSPEMQVQFRINSMGIRSDQEYTFEKPPRTIRIVGLGDLFTQGYEVNVRDTYLHHLEEKLRAKDTRLR